MMMNQILGYYFLHQISILLFYYLLGSTTNSKQGVLLELPLLLKNIIIIIMQGVQEKCSAASKGLTVLYTHTHMIESLDPLGPRYIKLKNKFLHTDHGMVSMEVDWLHYNLLLRSEWQSDQTAAATTTSTTTKIQCLPAEAFFSPSDERRGFLFSIANGKAGRGNGENGD